jgi:hypothetical protein
MDFDTHEGLAEVATVSEGAILPSRIRYTSVASHGRAYELLRKNSRQRHDFFTEWLFFLEAPTRMQASDGGEMGYQ